ncbi:MAG: GNAT family N-acetyltransferase [Actinobacteria bacterium]|nr:GNAT family N-acetyltransferase [Actinomycetota bacterium]
MKELVIGERVRLRRARSGDAELVASLANHDEIEPFMAAGAARDVEAICELIAASADEPTERGVFVIETEDGTRPAGVVMFESANVRSRIAHLYGLMVDSAFRGRGIGVAATRAFARHLLLDLGYHRVQLECYGFNERAIRHFERAGFVREGVRRKAYWRHEEWVDGVLFGLVREDLAEETGPEAMGAQESG